MPVLQDDLMDGLESGGLTVPITLQRQINRVDNKIYANTLVQQNFGSLPYTSIDCN